MPIHQTSGFEKKKLRLPCYRSLNFLRHHRIKLPPKAIPTKSIYERSCSYGSFKISNGMRQARINFQFSAQWLALSAPLELAPTGKYETYCFSRQIPLTSHHLLLPFTLFPSPPRLIFSFSRRLGFEAWITSRSRKKITSLPASDIQVWMWRAQGNLPYVVVSFQGPKCA